MCSEVREGAWEDEGYILTHSGKKKRHTRATIPRLATHDRFYGRDQRLLRGNGIQFIRCIDVAVAEWLDNGIRS